MFAPAREQARQKTEELKERFDKASQNFYSSISADERRQIEVLSQRLGAPISQPEKIHPGFASFEGFAATAAIAPEKHKAFLEDVLWTTFPNSNFNNLVATGINKFFRFYATLAGMLKPTVQTTTPLAAVA